MIMTKFEVEKTNTKSVVCSGRQVPYDHPTVYLEINITTNSVACPYCSKKFELDPNRH
jgi:uncharacterized Zn-finger protein